MKDRNGRLLKGDDARRRWAEYFENLLNVVEDREAEIMAVAGVQVPVMEAENDGEITKEEVERALKETKSGKAPGVDGVHAEMLKDFLDQVSFVGVQLAIRSISKNFLYKIS